MGKRTITELLNVLSYADAIVWDDSISSVPAAHSFTCAVMEDGERLYPQAKISRLRFFTDNRTKKQQYKAAKRILGK